MSYDLVIFDCDGTLVDSEYLNNFAMIDLLHQHGLTQYDMDYAMNNCVGMRYGKILARITDETGYVFPDDMAAHYNKHVMNLSSTYLKPIDGAQDAVKFAKTQTEICVVSNGERTNVLNSLTKTGLRDFFGGDEYIISALMAPNPKPAPDLFLLAAELKGVEPSKCLVIEDSVVGAQGGINAGMDVWGVTFTHHEPAAHEKRLRDIGVSEVFHTMDDKIAVLKSRFAAAL